MSVPARWQERYHATGHRWGDHWLREAATLKCDNWLCDVDLPSVTNYAPDAFGDGAYPSWLYNILAHDLQALAKARRLLSTRPPYASNAEQAVARCVAFIDAEVAALKQEFASKIVSHYRQLEHA